MDIKKVSIIGILMLLFDSIYLTTVGGTLFTPMISQIQSMRADFVSVSPICFTSRAKKPSCPDRAGPFEPL